MRRSMRIWQWLALLSVAGLTGCPGEPLPPPASIESAASEQPTRSNFPGEQPAPNTDAAPQSAPTPETADAAVETVLNGLQADRPDFHVVTKESLTGKDKTVLVFCYAPRELKW